MTRQSNPKAALWFRSSAFGAAATAGWLGVGESFYLKPSSSAPASALDTTLLLNPLPLLWSHWSLRALLLAAVVFAVRVVLKKKSNRQALDEATSVPIKLADFVLVVAAWLSSLGWVLLFGYWWLSGYYTGPAPLGAICVASALSLILPIATITMTIRRN